MAHAKANNGPEGPLVDSTQSGPIGFHCTPRTTFSHTTPGLSLIRLPDSNPIPSYPSVQVSIPRYIIRIGIMQDGYSLYIRADWVFVSDRQDLRCNGSSLTGLFVDYKGAALPRATNDKRRNEHSRLQHAYARSLPPFYS